MDLLKWFDSCGYDCFHDGGAHDYAYRDNSRQPKNDENNGGGFFNRKNLMNLQDYIDFDMSDDLDILCIARA